MLAKLPRRCYVRAKKTTHPLMSLRIYPKNDNEAAFLKALLDRMQIVYEENSLDTDALYQGLNLDELLNMLTP